MGKKRDKDFNSWMNSRIYIASHGMILDLNEGNLIEVETARSDVFLEHTRRRGEYHRKEQGPMVLLKALDQDKADPNDPFAFARTKAHLEGGLCELEDYNIDFRRIAVDLMDFTGRTIGRKMVDMPMNVRRA